uniref:non-specific serine/threonine protein kinase n=1 Tax=Oryzias latipes TaxID=8090 RepID=A0A3P9IWX7_ORYLA
AEICFPRAPGVSYTESAKYGGQGAPAYLEKPLDKRFRGNPAEEDNPKLRFEAKYVELHPLGEGGCGSVFAGYRRSDHLDVAIKHVPNKYQYCKHVDEEGRQLSGEVAVISRAPIALLDWYVLPHELILVLERPMPAVDLQTYVEERRDTFGEKEAKMILKQLVKAAISLQDKKIFHRDIKVENILIDMSSGAPQVRLIDFGVSCFTESHSEYTTFYGTEIHAPPEWWYEHTYSARPTTVWQLGIVLFECLHNKRFNSTKLMEKNELFHSLVGFSPGAPASHTKKVTPPECLSTSTLPVPSPDKGGGLN